jgi:hypothetical protein
MSDYVGANSATVALVLVGMGMPAEAVWRYVTACNEQLHARSLIDTLTLDDLRKLGQVSP